MHACGVCTHTATFKRNAKTIATGTYNSTVVLLLIILRTKIDTTYYRQLPTKTPQLSRRVPALRVGPGLAVIAQPMSIHKKQITQAKTSINVVRVYRHLKPLLVTSGEILRVVRRYSSIMGCLNQTIDNRSVLIVILMMIYR